MPEIRDSVSLQSLAVARLGKDVVDLLDASVSYDDREVLHEVEWRIAPGERTGILGVNGAGKSTLLGLVSGEIAPTAGRVKRGKTVQVATLSQRMDELDEHLDSPVRVVLAGLRTTYSFGAGSKAQELTPGQLLERLGFSSAQLSTPVKDLSGGQKRRLQLLLVLLSQPNVLILDEPTNDLDTDMLAAMEDLLDSWPGTLVVVSHDRYFLERVTDQQYAILDGRFRHLPGGVDEYLRLRAAQPGSRSLSDERSNETKRGTPASSPTLAGAERRAAEKELSAIDRRLAKLQSEITALDARFADAHDDYDRLLELQRTRDGYVAEVATLEERWLELGEALDD